MKSLLSLLILACALALPAAYAEKPGNKPTVICKDGSSSEPGQGACSHHGGVAPEGTMVTCKDGTMAEKGQGACGHHGGVKPKPPAGATAACKDGTYSHSKQHEGACSEHGGVAEWLDKD